VVYTDKKILVADYFQELVAFARVLGMGTELLQDSGGVARTHFRLTSETTTARAIKLGATVVSRVRADGVAARMNREGEREIMRECDTCINGHGDTPVFNGKTGQAELL
jgi:hypothetical protein